jgi:hypothetical protein
MEIFLPIDFPSGKFKQSLRVLAFWWQETDISEGLKNTYPKK